MCVGLDICFVGKIEFFLEGEWVFGFFVYYFRMGKDSIFKKSVINGLEL